MTTEHEKYNSSHHNGGQLNLFDDPPPDPTPQVTDSGSLTSRTCSVEGCGDKHLALGYCVMHYQRYKNGIPFSKPRKPMPKVEQKCLIEGCNRKHKARGLCKAHYNRAQRGADVHKMFNEVRKYNADYNELKNLPIGSTRPTPDGYQYLKVNNAGGRAVWVIAHRHIMSEHLGRPLIETEHVHHKNGIRDDNRIENLELWSKHHPPGQRVDDLIDFLVTNYPERVQRNPNYHP